jgi:hypothetical protein
MQHLRYMNSSVYLGGFKSMISKYFVHPNYYKVPTVLRNGTIADCAYFAVYQFSQVTKLSRVTLPEPSAARFASERSRRNSRQRYQFKLVAAAPCKMLSDHAHLLRLFQHSIEAAAGLFRRASHVRVTNIWASHGMHFLRSPSIDFSQQ